MMMAPFRGPEAGRALAAALIARMPGGTRLIDQDRTPWASATFIGTQHSLQLSCPDPAALAAFAHGIADADIPLRGHLLADITASASGTLLSVEALTLVEA